MCHGVCASDVTGLACDASDVTGLACVMASVRQMSWRPCVRCRHVMLKLLLCRGLVTLTVSASQQSSLEITRGAVTCLLT